MRRLLPSLLAALLLVSVCCPAAADEPQPVHRYSDDRLPPPSARLNLLLTGTLMTAGFYGAGLGASYLWPEAHGAEDLRIPVAGPFMAVGRTKMCADEPDPPDNCNNVTRVIGAVLYALDGVGQVGGLGLIVQSLFMRAKPMAEQPTPQQRAAAWRRHYLSQSSHKKTPLTFSSDKLEVSARPTPPAGADFGIGFFGRF